MNKPKLLKQTQKREFFAHHMLLNIASNQLETAKSTEILQFNNSLVAMTFSALAIEALANAIGSRSVDEWSDFESISPLAKVRLIAERLDIPYKSTNEPWSTLRYLIKFRNAIAHAKPEKILEEKILSEAKYNAQLFRTPASKVEQEITLGNAIRCFDAVHALKGIFTDALPVDKRFGIYVDAWSGGTELIEDMTKGL